MRLPTAIVLPFEGNSRQSQLIHKQVEYNDTKRLELWLQIIKQKINNQSRALSILGFDGAEVVSSYINSISTDNVDYTEALAAKEYFSYYHDGLNRHSNGPINSKLNYGYAIVRSAIARAITSIGCHPALGIHHNNQLNAFNLVDDLIEPYRAIVDLVAHENIGSNERLTKTEYTNLRKFLIKDGYIRIAPEVFMRITPTRRSSEKHFRRLESVAPKTGVVRILRMTEKQYDSVLLLTGEPDYQEKIVGRNCQIML